MTMINFIGQNRKINTVPRTNGMSSISIPSYVNKARNRFRYDSDSEILSKECSCCNLWFDVANVGNNGNWNDIHNEEEIHLTNSGFSSYCQKCAKTKKAEKDANEPISSKSKNAGFSKVSVNEGKERFSVYLTSESHKFIKSSAASIGVSIGEFLEQLINAEKIKSKKL